MTRFSDPDSGLNRGEPSADMQRARRRACRARPRARAWRLELLVLLAQRVHIGRRRYGPLDVARDRRDFGREALEELADACFYVPAAVLRAQRPRGQRRRPAGARGRRETTP
jgi:hypothetical protein